MKPTQELLKQYYELWRKGADDSSIRDELHLTESQFKNLTPHFLQYCRHHAKFDAIDSLDNGVPPNVAQLTIPRRKKFLEYVSLGLDFSKAASFMNIPLVTITDVWFKEDPFLKEDAQNAAEIVNAEVQMALLKRAKGYEQEVITETHTEGESSKEGQFSSTVTSKSTKVVVGDVSAEKFWLINKEPDNFTLDGEVNRKGNKGAIMDALDQIIGSDKDDDLDERFEEDE